MNLPEVLNVALGLVVLFLLLSTVGSVLVELVGHMLRYREEILTVTVNRLLTGMDDRPWGVRRLFRDYVAEKLITAAPLSLIRSAVNRIRPKEESVSSSGDAARDRANAGIVRQFWSHAKIRSLATQGSVAPAWLEPATFATVLIDLSIPRDSAGALPETRVALERRLGPGNTNVPESLRRSLLTLGLSSTIPGDAAGDKLWTAFRENIAGWFQEAMDSASSHYRKISQRWLLWIGFIMALILNADTIRTIHVLSHDKALAEQVAAYAEIIKAQNDAKLPEEVRTIELARVEAADSLRAMQKLERMGFPLGWRFEPASDFLPSVLDDAPAATVTDAAAPQDPPVFPSPLAHPVAWLVKLLGLALTALAVSQGAPFWYDLLNKLVSIRRGPAGTASPAPAPEAAATAGTSASGGVRAAAGAATVAAGALPLEIGRDLARATVGFDARKACWMAEAANLAYAPASEITRMTGKEWFFTASEFWNVQVSGVDTQAYAVVDDDVAIVSFRGTEPKVLNDILTDAKFQQTPFAADAGTAGWGLVHGGFANALSPVFSDILQWLVDRKIEGKALYITGHSLGAALGTLFAARLLGEPAAATWRFQLYTFGSPLVGNRTFAAAFDRRMQGRVFRLVHGGDIVTQVPPRALQFSHVGEMLHLTKPDGLRREVSSLDRLLDFAIAGVGDLSTAAREVIEDHSMTHYVERCRKLATQA